MNPATKGLLSTNTGAQRMERAGAGQVPARGMKPARLRASTMQRTNGDAPANRMRATADRYHRAGEAHCLREGESIINPGE
jgi:hypothetical protein